MAKLIGAAGHVDHGKTSLIHALTGIDADRLPEEKLRGMTIDVGFAYIDFPSVGRVSIVDVPGHEKLVHNMLVGAMGVDLALLCVAADEGVCRQTQEHFQILELLPVGQMVVALTRTDLADEISLQLSMDDVRELLGESRFGLSPVIPVSAVTKSGLDDLRAALEAALLQPSPESSQHSWYLPVDRVFTVKGHGCIATGTLAGGSVKAGDRAVIQPGNVEVRLRAIQNHDEPVEEGEAGQRIAFNLAGPKLEELYRGQVIGAPGAVFATRILDAAISWLERPKHATRIRLSIGAEEAIGRLFFSDESLDIVQIRLEKEIACVTDQPLIVRRYSPPDLLGGGRVKVPQAVPRRKSESPAVVSGGSVDEQILGVLSLHPLGIATEEICRLLGKSPQSLGDAFERLSGLGQVRGFAGLWLGKAEWEVAQNRFIDALNRLHAESPMKAYLPREAVLSSEKLPWTGKPLDRMMSALASESKIALNGTHVKSSAFKVSLNPKQRSFLDRVKEALDAGAMNPAAARDLAQTLHVPPQAVDEVLRLGLEAGELVRVFEDIFYTMTTIDGIKKQLKEKFGSRAFTAAEFRDAFATSRRYAIPLLEYLDATGFTLRTSDKRVIRAANASGATR